MSTYLLNLLQLLALYPMNVRNIKFQKQFIQKELAEILEQHRETTDGSLDEEDFRKAMLYGYAIPAMLGEAYCVLRGKPMDANERLAMTFLAATTGLFDDLFDKRNVSEDYIKELINIPIPTKNTNSNEKLLIALYAKALDKCGDPKLTKDYCLQVFEAQIASKMQKLKATSKEEIKKITFNKGGTSIVVYSSALNDELSEVDKSILFKLGGIGQLENDIFDIYKDYAEGIKTLVTLETNMAKLREFYLSLIDEVLQLVNQTNYLEANKNKFLRMITLVMYRGIVCLDQWESLERKTNNSFEIEQYSQNELTCDMEKLSNLLKLLHYSAKRY